jgi:2-polyprenyl-3-methyl-5-hydroxy-6-metoxy-1,4-benzoquinol methylase
MNHSLNFDFNSISAHWYRTFFTSPMNKFWEALMNEATTVSECDFIVSQLRTEKQCELLDVACGAGRHSLELARRGKHVTGIDLSLDAIERARSAAQEQRLAINFVHADMLNLPDKLFDGAYCFGNSFGYLTHSDTIAFLHSLHERLRPGARVTIDTGVVAESLLPNLKSNATYETAGFVFSIANQYDVERGRLLTHVTLAQANQVWRQGFSQAVYTCAELARMFTAAGFVVVGRYANLDCKSFALGEPRLLLVAQRN